MFLRRLQTGFMDSKCTKDRSMSTFCLLEQSINVSILIYHSNEGSAVASRHLADHQIKGVRRKFIILL